MLYTGTLMDGTVFDSTKDRGPFSTKIGVHRVIKCWDEGVPQLTKTQKAIITCPPDYAYGTRGAGCKPNGTCVIPPNATI